MKMLNKTTDGRTPHWRGYTMEELYIRRAEIYARKEIEKYRLSLSSENMRRSTPFLGGSSGLMGKASNLFSYLEYGLIAYRVAKRFLPFMKKKK